MRLGREGRDGMEKNGTGMERDGEGLDGVKTRDRKAWRGTAQDGEGRGTGWHGEGRDRTVWRGTGRDGVKTGEERDVVERWFLSVRDRWFLSIQSCKSFPFLSSPSLFLRIPLRSIYTVFLAECAF